MFGFWFLSEDLTRRSVQSSGGVFVRQATGLVKNVSLLDSIAINISYMSIGAALGLIGFTMILLPTVAGVNLVYGSAIAALFAVPQMIVYTIMQRHVSRTGGDYVWMSRSLGGFAGSTLTFMGMTLETMPYLALIALSAVSAIGSVGAILGYSGFTNLSILGAFPLEQFLLASFIFVILVLLNIFRPRSGFKIISLFWAIGILSIVVAVVSLLVAGRSGVENYINSLGIANTTYDSIAASYPGTTTFNLGNTLLIMPFFALFSYPWFNAAPSVGSELKGGNTVRWSTPLSLLAAFLLLTVPFAAMYYVGGFAFTNAALFNFNLVNKYSFNFWTLAMGVSGSYFVKFFIGLGWILFIIAVLAFGIITISRYLFAQAFDRFLPERLAYVSPKYGSPVIAHIIDLAVTIGLIGLASFLYGTLYSLYGVLVAAMIYFAFVGLGAIVYSRKQLKGGREQIALAVAGLLQIFVFSYLTYEFVAYGNVWGGNPLAYGYVVASFVVGVIIYLVSKSRQATKGINISYAFREIPPE